MKLRQLIVILTTSLLPGPALAAAPGSGIIGTAHDFSAASWSGGEICTVCHTPHNADQTVADAPLWNHTVTSETFTPYAGYELDASVGQPGGVSKLCLSCHDGSVALDSFGGRVGFIKMTDFGAGGVERAVGRNGDLTDDHPVSFTYDAALATADGGLHNPATTDWNGSGSGSIADEMLFGGKVECATCHDVHNKDAVATPFLVKRVTNGALCLTCHDK